MAPAPRHSPDEQEKIILNAAVTCIGQSSILDFTMSALSKESELSMGSIYKHIQTKEDVFVALATQMYKELHQVFSTILNLAIPFPLRLIALQLTGKESACCFEFGGHLEMLVSNEAVLQRASSNWLERILQLRQALALIIHKSALPGRIGSRVSVRRSNRPPQYRQR